MTDLPEGREVRQLGTPEADHDWLFHGDVYVESCPTCGHVPGEWQMAGFAGARREDVTLNECRDCGACWPSG